MHYVYILYSTTANKFYVGQTEDITLRLKQHNTGFFKGSFTTQCTDWQLFHKIACPNQTIAIKIEAHIKRMKNRKYYQDLKQHSAIAERLLVKYSNPH